MASGLSQPCAAAPLLTVQDADRLKIMELATACSVPMALKAFIKLQIPHILASAGPDTLLTAEQIIPHIRCSSEQQSISSSSSSSKRVRSLERILRLVASQGIVREEVHSEGRKYGLTGACELLVSDPGIGAFVLLLQDKVLMDSWQFLDETVYGLEACRQAHGVSFYQIAATDARFGSAFDKAMAGHSAVTMPALLRVYTGFKQVKTLVDVGGGNGSCIGQIVAAHPHIRGINLELPKVISKAEIIPGVEHVMGDMFQQVPTAEAMFFKRILHNWDDDACIRLLKNCHKALPEEGGKVIVMDAILEDHNSDSAAGRVSLNLDLVMLLTQGCERSLAQMVNLAKAAGFLRVEWAAVVDNLSVLELYKH